MSGGGTNTVSQQTVPSWLQPFLTQNLQMAQQDMGRPPQYYPGQQVADLSPLQQQGISSIGSAAQTPSASDAAQTQNQFMSSGALLDPNANPYLQGQFKLGAGQIQNQLSSEFAGAGSNVINSAPLQQQGMSDLASNLYGNAYAQGLTATNQAAALAPGLDQGTYLPGQALLSAGGTQQTQAQNDINAQMQAWNFNQNEPFNLESWYSGLLNGNAAPFGGSTSSGTQTASPATEAIGAGVGAAGLYGALSSLFAAAPETAAVAWV